MFRIGESEVERLRAERDELAKVNTALTLELTQLASREWEALNHVYLKPCERRRITSLASLMARQRGIHPGEVAE